MKELLIAIFNKYKKIIILASIGIILILTGNISWKVYFSKVKMFKENEKKFYEAAVRYYEYHKQQLPKKGESKTLTLQDMYDKKLIDDLYAPSANQICDVNESRVRVYQDDNGEYKYNSYLKCGSFESKGDHTGPSIILNGDSTITLAINSEYKELGVTEVKDDTDGVLDTSKVTIDSSNVNMKKLGDYTVRYSISDSSYNKTTVERKVSVRKNLTEEVKNATDKSGYYKDEEYENYLLFSGNLWRIVNVNSDGTIKIVSEQNISNINYSKSGAKYEDSNMKEWLNNVFYASLNNTKNYVVEDAKWCLDKDCKETITDKVGLLTVKDYNSTLKDKRSYLNRFTAYYLLTKEGNDVYYYNSNGELEKVPPTTVAGVKPVLILKSNLFVASGDGTVEKPYMLGDYKQAKKNELLNTRIIGEYVNYSGMTFRISGFDKDKNIKLTSVTYLGTTVADDGIAFAYDNEDKKMIFNSKQEGNIGYNLNHNGLDYVDESLIVPHETIVYKYDENKKYSEYKQMDKYKVKVSMPSTFDLFSGTDKSVPSYARYWLADYVDDNHAFMINGANGRTFKVDQGKLRQNNTRLVIYVSNKAKIIKGKGTALSQYYIK